MWEEEGLPHEHHGYPEGKSTIPALSRVKELAKQPLEEPYTSRNGVLNELQKRGISPYLCNIIDSYFGKRTLMVGEASIFEITCGFHRDQS